MDKKRRIPCLRQLFQWIAAGVVAVLCMNVVMFGYYRLPGVFDRKNAATNSIFEPGSIVVNAVEGYAIRRIDSKGYFNSAVPTEPGYVVCVGASHTRAWEVAEEESYPGMLNLLLGGTKENVKAYNVSQQAYTFPAIVKNFKTICGEFPDAGAFVIDTLGTGYSAESLNDALEQCEYDEKNNGDYLLAHQSLAGKIKFFIKNSLPIVSATKRQLANIDIDDATAVAAVNKHAAPAETTVTAEKTSKPQKVQLIEMDEEAIALDRVLARLKENFAGEIIILYHPNASILADGTLRVSESESTAVFAALCEKNQIGFVDATETFKEAYAQDYIVPYGFFNTSMGSGHLNADGHALVAKDLYKALTGGDVK